MRSSLRRTALALVVAMSLIATATGTSSASAPRREPPYARALRPKLEAIVNKMLVPGAIVVVRSDKLGNWSTTFGTRTLGGTQPVGIDDHFRIASNTKTMTGTVILQLVQEGKLRLDDPVAKYRPDVPNGQNITIAQALNMTSGLFSYTASPELIQAYTTNPQRVFTPEELLALGLAKPPYFPPGQGFHYSNTNTVLLGLIIEKVTGESLATAFEQRIFKPLGLKNTSLPKQSSNAIPSPHPQGYYFGNFAENQSTGGVLPPDQQAAAYAGTLKPTDVTGQSPSFGWAAGGVISTAPDLARYVKALVGGGLLNKKVQKQRLDSLQLTSPDDPYRYGFNIDQFGPMIGHSGDIPGFSTLMYYDPTRKITVIVSTMINKAPDGQVPAAEMTKAIIAQLYPGPAPGPEAVTP